MARVDRRRRHDPRGRRRPHRPRRAARASSRSTPTGRCRSARSRAASNVTGIVTDTHGDRDAAARARRAVVLGLRRRGAVRRHRDERRRAERPARPTRTRSSSRRTSSSAGPATPGRARRPPRAVHQPGARRARRRHGRLRQPDGARATSTTRRTARRAARRRSSSRSAPGWSSSSRRPSASRRSGPHEERLLRPRDRGLARRARRSRSSATSTPSGSRSCRSSCARPSGRYLHHNFVVALLNDLFGIQSRGGCSCAGPYGHRLLGIDLERSHEFEREITGGCEGIKPGWVRVNFNYFLSDTVADYVVEAVRLVARDGWRLLGDYRFDPATGLWRHRDGPVEPPLRLRDVALRRRRVDDRTRARDDPRRSGAARAAPARRAPRSSPRPTPPDLTSHPADVSRRLRAPALVRPAGERDRPMTAAAPGSDPSSPGSAVPLGDPVPGWSARPWPPGVTLAGRTAVLEALHARHASDLTAAWAGTDEAHWAYLPMDRPEGAVEVAGLVSGMVDDPEWVSYAVLVGGRAVGALSLMRVDPANGSIEIGAVVFGAPLVRTVGVDRGAAAADGARVRRPRLPAAGVEVQRAQRPLAGRRAAVGLLVRGGLPPGDGRQGAQPRHGLVLGARRRVAGGARRGSTRGSTRRTSTPPVCSAGGSPADTAPAPALRRG